MLEDTLCPSELDMLPSLGIIVHTEQEIMPRLTGHLLLAFPEGSSQPDPAKFRKLWSPDKMLSAHAKQVRKTFTFLARHLAEADQMLDQLRSIAPEKDAVFVGVHARRTDYQEYSKKVQGVKSPGRGYYREAMDHYLEDYQDHNTMVWFLVLSDDQDWAEKNILGRPQTVWAGSDDPGRDMALLAACDHSVTSQVGYHHHLGELSIFICLGELW